MWEGNPPLSPQSNNGKLMEEGDRMCGYIHLLCLCLNRGAKNKVGLGRERQGKINREAGEHGRYGIG